MTGSRDVAHVDEWGIRKDARAEALRRLEDALTVLTFDLLTDVRRLNAIDDALLYRVVLGGLLTHYGSDRIRRALLEARRTGPNVISIAAAPHWFRR
jgi:hypothetical protein